MKLYLIFVFIRYQNGYCQTWFYKYCWNLQSWTYWGTISPISYSRSMGESVNRAEKQAVGSCGGRHCPASRRICLVAATSASSVNPQPIGQFGLLSYYCLVQHVSYHTNSVEDVYPIAVTLPTTQNFGTWHGGFHKCLMPQLNIFGNGSNSVKEPVWATKASWAIALPPTLRWPLRTTH